MNMRNVDLDDTIFKKRHHYYKFHKKNHGNKKKIKKNEDITTVPGKQLVYLEEQEFKKKLSNMNGIYKKKTFCG